MPDVHVIEEVRDANGNVIKRVTESLGPNRGDVVVTTTTYDGAGGKQMEVKETYHRPPGDPRNRSNLIERTATEYGPDGQPTQETTELFGDGVNESPFSKTVYTWGRDNTVDPPARFLEFFRRFHWVPGAPGAWKEDFWVQHKPDGSIAAAGP